MDIILPGLFWQNFDDVDSIYSEIKMDNFDKLVRRSSIKVHNFRYSDFVYNCIYDTTYAHGNYNRGLAYFLACEHDYWHNTNLCAKHSQFLIIQPTHLRVDRDRLLICEPELLQLNDDEEHTIISNINKHFNEEITVYFISTSFWLIGINFELDNNDTHPLIDIIGSNIDDYLPKGINSILYNKLLNEIQMLLFTLPLNNTRKTENLLTINSTWMWDTQINLSTIFDLFCKDTHRTRKNIFTNSKLLFSKAKAFNSKNTDNGLAECYNPYLHILDNEIVNFISDTNLLLIDNLYYPCCYADARGYIRALENFDMKVAAVLLESLKKHKIDQIHLFVPQQNQTIELTIYNSDKYKLWKHNTFPKIIKDIQ